MSRPSKEEIIINSNISITLSDKPIAEEKKSLKGLVPVIICSNLQKMNTTSLIAHYSLARTSYVVPTYEKKGTESTRLPFI